MESRHRYILFSYSKIVKEIKLQVGFDAGDGVYYYAVQESRTPAVVNISSMSNLVPSTPGKYVFQVNKAVVVPPSIHLFLFQLRVYVL